MNLFSNKLLLILCLLLVQGSGVAQVKYSCSYARSSIVSNFVNTLQAKDWKKIREHVYKLKSCKCEMAPIFYYIYRMRILLPNSHVLQGISPEEFILNQKLELSKQIKILKNCEYKTYLPLLNSMIKQKFEAEISQAAIDLKKKLALNI